MTTTIEETLANPWVRFCLNVEDCSDYTTNCSSAIIVNQELDRNYGGKLMVPRTNIMRSLLHGCQMSVNPSMHSLLSTINIKDESLVDIWLDGDGYVCLDHTDIITEHNPSDTTNDLIYIHNTNQHKPFGKCGQFWQHIYMTETHYVFHGIYEIDDIEVFDQHHKYYLNRLKFTL
jgi:hypothetical protein